VPHYEVMCIVRPDAEKQVTDDVIDRIENFVRQQDGTIMDCEILGRKRLAYEVKKFHEGIYVKLNFEAPSSSIGPLKGHMQLSEDIIRYLVLRTGTFIPTDEIGVERPADEPTVDEDAELAEIEPELDAAAGISAGIEPEEDEQERDGSVEDNE